MHDKKNQQKEEITKDRFSIVQYVNLDIYLRVFLKESLVFVLR